MTKPVTSVAAMMLAEEGRLSLDDPLSSVIPAFADVQVYDDGELRAPTRPILIRDLLTHTSGLTYGFFGNTPVDSLYRATLGALDAAGEADLEERTDVIASLPLVDDPGARWVYSMSTDVLGRVVEVVSGLTLGEFFRTRIFEPLGMTDTGFHVTAGKVDRLAQLYYRTPDGLFAPPAPGGDRYTRPPSWYSGGGGLISTAADYLRFCEMLLGEGEANGVRLLEPETVRLMTRNHLPGEMIPIMPGIGNQGFGLGFAVSVGRNPGTYWWSGSRARISGSIPGGNHCVCMDAASTIWCGAGGPAAEAHRPGGDPGRELTERWRTEPC